MKTNEESSRKHFGFRLQVVDLDLLEGPVADLGRTTNLRSSISPGSFLPSFITAISAGCPLWTLALWAHPRPSQISNIQLRNGASQSLKGSTCSPTGSWGPCAVVWESRRVQLRRSRKGSSEAPGRAFVALKTFQRACHGDAQRPWRDPRGPRLLRGTFQRLDGVTLAFRRASPWPPAPRAPSLLARTVPARLLCAPSAGAGRTAEAPLSPATF